MNAEARIVDFICNTGYDDLSSGALETVRNMLRADIGTIIAGAHSDGVPVLVETIRRQGGAPEASLLVHGGSVPVQNAAFVNAVMSRALDFCDAIAPGPHIGSATIPVALACAEWCGGCDGRELLTALAIGAEVAARFNLTEAAYDGFDPTGICVPFGAAATAARLLGLDRNQTWNALGIVFNRCGGSFQSNIDGTLSVRFNQGWVAQDAVLSVRLARQGITGPSRFIEGIYGYLHLYGKGLVRTATLIGGLGEQDRMTEMVYKKYPSCGATQGLTDVMIGIMTDNALQGGDIASVHVRLAPYSYKLVGHEFSIGDNPTVNAQFSARYCIANILLRGCSRIGHFLEHSVRDPAIQPFLSKVLVTADAALDARGHTALDMEVQTTQGRVIRTGLDVAPGFPGNPLSREHHVQRFHTCAEFAESWFPAEKAHEILSVIENIESVDDVRALIGLLQPG
jgi:2-methylcitrate dehydratase PrpD